MHIHADNLQFPDKLLRAGEQGGRRAAAMLSAAVQEYVETEGTATLGTRIVCRLYANVRGLGEVLVRTGAIDEVAVFEDFVRGFTRGKVLFDFVDVGAGKDRADEKIIGECIPAIAWLRAPLSFHPLTHRLIIPTESLKLFSQDSHCYRLFFGCSHDNGYARVLEEYLDNEEFQDKVILVEGVPFEKELACLLYKTVKFPGLFRDSKIVVRGQNTILASPPITPSDCGSPEMKTYNIYAGLPSRFPPPVRSPSANLMDSPIPTRLSMNLPRTPSSSTLASDGLPSKAAPPGMGSWAAKAAAPAPPASEKLVYKPANRETVIARNRAGQRVDPPNKDYDKAEVDRVKKLKMCNVHFLRQECPYDDGCTHVHDCHPTKEEVATLRLVARMAPCLNGSGCSDIKCIYGHRCPAPSHRSNSAAKGTKSCIFGEACKFPPELHDIDTNVVKTLVIR